VARLWIASITIPKPAHSPDLITPDNSLQAFLQGKVAAHYYNTDKTMICCGSYHHACNTTNVAQMSPKDLELHPTA